MNERRQAAERERQRRAEQFAEYQRQERRLKRKFFGALMLTGFSVVAMVMGPITIFAYMGTLSDSVTCNGREMHPGDTCVISSRHGGGTFGYEAMARRQQGDLSTGLMLGVPAILVGATGFWWGRRVLKRGPQQSLR